MFFPISGRLGPSSRKEFRDVLPIAMIVWQPAQDIFALYADFTAGGACVYKVNGKYRYGIEGKQPQEMIDDNPGDLAPLLALEPGIRVRFFKNIHIFLGPTISTLGMGIHAGIGF